MTTRRGFLRGMLAAAAAPAIVRAQSLMPIKAPEIWTPPPLPPLFTGEIGHINGFRFIEQRELPRNMGDTIKFRRYNPFAQRPEGFVSVAALNAVRREEAERSANPMVAFVNSSWADDLRAAGVPVEKPLPR